MHLKAFLKNNYREVLFVAVIIACAILILCTLLLLDEYADELEEQAETRVELCSEDTTNLLSLEIADFKMKAAVAARYVAEESESLPIEIRLREIVGDPEFPNLQFAHYITKSGEVFDAYHNPILTEPDVVMNLVGSEEPACSGVIHDPDTIQDYVAFYAPLRANDAVEGIVLYYPLYVLKEFSATADHDLLEEANFVVFCSSSGEIYDILKGDGTIAEHNNVFEILNGRLNDKFFMDEFRRSVTSRTSAIFPVKIAGVSYVLSLGGTGTSGGGFCVVGLYLSEDAYSSGYQFVNTILGTMVIFLTILICFAIYFLVSRAQTKKKIEEIGLVDPDLDCPTQMGFERAARDILDRNKATQFAIVIAELKHYKYVTENFPEQAAQNVLSYLKLVYSKSMQIDECYGHGEGGIFILLLHYRDRDTLLGRLRVISSVAGNFTGLRTADQGQFIVKLDIGIYEIPTEGMKPTVHAMITFAEDAKNALVRAEDIGEFKFYNEKISLSYRQNADIEVRQEAALKAGEFRVFFQPKYNISRNRPDGSEALVRWYDPEKNEYRSPALFMPLFEANGFVVKIDRYIYTRVCEYISERAARHLTLYPVSVNVSRITAVQPDFIEYYTKMKKKYGIADKFITIEFTESFAYENYETMSTIIDALHHSGFLCSIDDFGSGYSSYNILKALPMDEIKLDKFFIERGLSVDRDDKILDSIITVAKKIGLKVTQEGVETKDELDRLTELGCDVIQGYYYSKPLAMSDYESFLDKHDSHTTFK